MANSIFTYPFTSAMERCRLRIRLQMISIWIWFNTRSNWPTKGRNFSFPKFFLFVFGSFLCMFQLDNCLSRLKIFVFFLFFLYFTKNKLPAYPQFDLRNFCFSKIRTNLFLFVWMCHNPLCHFLLSITAIFSKKSVLNLNCSSSVTFLLILSIFPFSKELSISLTIIFTQKATSFRLSFE